MVIQPFESVRKGDLAITCIGDTFKILNKGTLAKMYKMYGKYQSFSLEEVTYDE